MIQPRKIFSLNSQPRSLTEAMHTGRVSDKNTNPGEIGTVRKKRTKEQKENEVAADRNRSQYRQAVPLLGASLAHQEALKPIQNVGLCQGPITIKSHTGCLEAR